MPKHFVNLTNYSFYHSNDSVYNIYTKVVTSEMLAIEMSKFCETVSFKESESGKGCVKEK